MSDDQPREEHPREDPPREEEPAHRVDEPAAEEPVGWQGLEPDTSERLFAVDELAAYEQSRMDTPTPLPTPPHGDPLSGPMPGEPAPTPPHHDPLSGPMPGEPTPPPPALPPPLPTRARRRLLRRRAHPQVRRRPARRRAGCRPP